MRHDHDDRSTRVTRAIGRVTGALGSTVAIGFALGIITAWGVGGWFVPGHFGNDTYQLLINTFTTIVTFVMVFIIQNTQNRDGRAMQAKLDAQAVVLKAIAEELGACDADELALLVGIEDAPERVIAGEQDTVRARARR